MTCSLSLWVYELNIQDESDFSAGDHYPNSGFSGNIIHKERGDVNKKNDKINIESRRSVL